MRVRSFFALAAIAATSFAALAGIPAASAATTVQVTVADMYTYSSGSPLEKTVCIDGEGFNSDAPQLHGPMALDSGDHHLKVYIGHGANCLSEDLGDIDETITLSDAPFQTILLYWPSETGAQVSVLTDDLSCPAAGTGRIVYRPGAAVSGDQNTDLGYGDFVPFVEDVAVGTQGAAEVAAGTYDDWNAIIHGDGMVVEGPASGDVAAGGTIFVYTYGGNDGGRAMLVLPEIACATPPPPTPPTPTGPPAPAPQVVAQARFTG
jgi:hypothetical protein